MIHESMAPRYPAAALALLATAQFIIAVDYNIVYVALPSIGEQLGFSARNLQWVVSAYALAFGGLLLLGGRLGDVFGRRRAFMVALALYGTASVAGGFAGSQLILIASRAVQGMGGALLLPATLALVITFFAEGSDRNRALAVIGAAGASGGASGALLGGLLTSAFGWSWTFFVNVPVVAAALIGATYLLPRDAHSTPIRTYTSTSLPVYPPEKYAKTGAATIDIPGALTSTAGLSLLVLSFVEGPVFGWISPTTLGMLLASAALLALFFVIESRSARPLMPLRLLRHPTLSVGMVVAALFAASFGAQYYLLTSYLQQIRHYAPSMAGIAFLPFSLAIVLGTRLAAPMVSRSSLKSALLIGLGLGIFGLIYIGFGSTANGSYLTHMLPGFVMDGVGQGITWTLMWVVATQGLDPQDRGIASGMASTAQQIGNALGLALLVGIASSGSRAGMQHDTQSAIAGLQHAFFAASFLALIAAYVVAMRVKKVTPVTLSTPVEAISASQAAPPGLSNQGAKS